MTPRRLIDGLASLRLTVWLLAASVPLILASTLDQVELGLPATLAKYFHAVIAIWDYPASWPGGAWLHRLALPVPGGLLLGPLFVLNLVAAHFRHGHWTWRRGGLIPIHLGILMLLLGQIASDLTQRDGYVWFEVGQTASHVTSFTEDELVVVDLTDPARDKVVAVDFRALADAGEAGLGLPSTPFRVVPRIVADHAALQRPAEGAPVVPLASRGLGAAWKLQVEPGPVPVGMDERATPAAVLELLAGETSLGTWLVSSLLDERFPDQQFEHAGRRYAIALRPSRTYLPFSLTLLEFRHDRYPGTDLPRNFSSRVRLAEPAAGEDREAEIRMNQPLRHGGWSFYQQAFGMDSQGRPDRASRLQAVRNPSRLVPYVACVLVTIGLAWQFGVGLAGAVARSRKADEASPAP